MRVRKNSLNKLKSHFFIKTLSLLTFIFLFSFISTYKNNISIHFEEINLIIKGNALQNILSNEFNSEPDQVFINGILKNSCKKTCFLDYELNNITIRFENKLESCKNMFKDLTNVIEIDLTKFNTSKVKNMEHMFDNCINLKKIIFGKINTSLVENMNSLFNQCSNLTSIDLSNFDTSSVTNMTCLFNHCESLLFINASKFNTSRVVEMFDIFAYCYELLGLDVSSFDTSNAKNMQGMFYRDYKLKYLDLPNFDFSSAENINFIFDDCKELTYLNLYLYKAENESMINKISSGHKNTKYCFIYTNQNSLNAGNKIINCSNICFNTNITIKIEHSLKICVQSCNETEKKYEYFNICFNECPGGTYGTILNKYLCLDKKPEGFYLDLEENIYKECYSICKNCDYQGNQFDNNCTECKYDLILLDEPLNSNCYNKCRCYYYFDESNNYKCTSDYMCPNEYKIIKEKNKCISECKYDNKYKYEYNYTCYETCPNKTIFENDYICYMTYNYLPQQKFLKGMQNTIKNNILNISEEEDFIFHNYEQTYTITSTTNQKNNKNNNLTTIDLGYCETKLKQIYNISENSSLYMLKIDSFMEGYKIPKIDYEIYYPINNNETKLDLSICKNYGIYISIPINISTSDLDKYNASSGYYNDICYTSKSEHGTDKQLSDRRNEFIDNNMTVCEDNCKFIDYNNSTKKAICSCSVKILSISTKDTKIESSSLLSNFKVIKNIANLKMLKCIYLIFDKKRFFKNTANYLMLLILIISIIAIFIFCFKDYPNVKKLIYDIYEKRKFYEKEKPAQNTKKKISFKNKKSLDLKKSHNNHNNKKKNVLLHKKNAFPPKRKSVELTRNENRKKLSYKSKMSSMTKQISSSKAVININRSKFNSKVKKLEIYKGKNNENNESDNYTDYEINNFDFSRAIIYDNRTYCQYYKSLIKSKHVFVFTFFNNEDYNSKIIKIYIFFFNFLINYNINAMFYSETMMHQIHIEKGAFNLIYQLPQIIYSSIINSVLNIILKNLGLYQNNVYEIKSCKIEYINKKIKKEFNKIKIKVIIFFIITYILLVFFWLYLGCFCVVYINTQLHLLKEVSSSFATSLIIPLIIYIFPGFFRIPSLKNRQPSLYKFSKIIQLF